MSVIHWVRDGIAQRRVAIFLKVIAVIMLVAGLSHLASILSLTGTPWGSRPLRFQAFDVMLLLANLTLAPGLWRTRFWAVVGWVATVLLLQYVPILLFTDLFASNARERATLYTMLVIHAMLLGTFFALLPRRRGDTP